MKLEELELEIKNIIEKKYSKEERLDKKDYFILQIRGTHKGKEVKYSDLIKGDRPVITVQDTTYKKCFESLLKIIRDD